MAGLLKVARQAIGTVFGEGLGMVRWLLTEGLDPAPICGPGCECGECPAS